MPKTQPRAHSPEVSVGLSPKRGRRIRLPLALPSARRGRHGELSAGAAAEHSGLAGVKHRGYPGCLAIGIQDKKPSRGAWLPPFALPELAAGPEEAVEVSVWLQRTLSANQRT